MAITKHSVLYTMPPNVCVLCTLKVRGKNMSFLVILSMHFSRVDTDV